MSTLKADTIVASDGTSPATLTKQSPAKAWGHFEGGVSATLGDSFGTSSLVYVSTGKYTANLSNAMSNVNYCGNMNATDTSVCSPIASGYTTSSFQFGIRSSAMGFIDKDDTTYTINGDLA
tara:strand:- start:296 stop:658 length:363 start_codon:yes stop_codon:yes gene_type:complete